MRNYYVLILISSIFSYSQTQIGSDIDGEDAFNKSGFSISLSPNGNRVAIGAPFNDSNNSGHVRVFQNIAGIWTQIGNDIDGESPGDNSGREVSLSSDGNIVAIGAIFNDGNGDNSGHVRVFENNNGNWLQIGNDIDGEAANNQSGFSVSLSEDGNIVAIGAPKNSDNGNAAGHVRVFQNITGVWTQIGSDIDGQQNNDRFGYSVSLSSDGSILAIGAPSSSSIPGNTSPGYVRIFQNVAGVWTQIGNDILGEAADDESGCSISLSSDGNIIAIGARLNSDNVFASGHVRVYQNLAGNWTQIGSDIDGDNVGDLSGWSVSLSSDGSILAIGEVAADGSGNDSGRVKIYQNLSGAWTQVGSDINGEAQNDGFGKSVSLSSNGSVVAVGAPENSGNGQISGHVRVYDISFILSNDVFTLNDFKVYPNPSNEILNIILDSSLSEINVNIYNALGQKILSSSNLQINVSTFTKGVYFIQVKTEKGQAIKKLIIN